MPKMTLLSMVQNILSATSSDEVNSISDTVESDQVATIVIETYYDMMSGRSNPSFEGLIKLDGLSDPSFPNVLKIPTNVKSIKWFRYNGVEIPYVTPEEFLDKALLNTTGQLITDTSYSANFYINNDKDPTLYTTFDNVHLTCDGFNSSEDSTLHQSRTTCWGQYDPIFVRDDESIAPYLDADEFPILLAEAKSVAFINLSQISNAKEEARARQGRIRRQNDKWRVGQKSSNGRDYGRKRP